MACAACCCLHPCVCCHVFLFPVHSSFIIVKNLVLINHTAGLTIPACPSHVYFYNKGMSEGAVKNKLMFMYVRFVWKLCLGWFFDLTQVRVYNEKSCEMVFTYDTVLSPWADPVLLTGRSNPVTCLLTWQCMGYVTRDHPASYRKCHCCLFLGEYWIMICTLSYQFCLPCSLTWLSLNFLCLQ